VEGGGRGLIEGSAPHSHGEAEENYERPQSSRYAGRNSNQKPPYYKAEALPDLARSHVL
jgi:hypothetical protein